MRKKRPAIMVSAVLLQVCPTLSLSVDTSKDRERCLLWNVHREMQRDHGKRNHLKYYKNRPFLCRFTLDRLGASGFSGVCVCGRGVCVEEEGFRVARRSRHPTHHFLSEAVDGEEVEAPRVPLV